MFIRHRVQTLKCDRRIEKPTISSFITVGRQSYALHEPHLSHLMWMWIPFSTREVTEPEKSKRILVNVWKCRRTAQARARSFCANWEMSEVLSNQHGRTHTHSTRSNQKYYYQTTAPENWISSEMFARFSLFLSLLEMRWVLLNQTAAIVKLENIFPSRTKMV